MNEDVAYRIGRAFVQILRPEKVVVGHDVLLDRLLLAAAGGLNDGGTSVIDIGLCGTEEMYFQTAHCGAGSGIRLTASHNPMDYNGMKLVCAGS